MMAITAIRNIIEINSKMDRLAAGEEEGRETDGIGKSRKKQGSRWDR
ncbi:MAG: hypothetical protein ACLTSZ_01520 [Lachnospiraceae bacterium]